MCNRPRFCMDSDKIDAGGQVGNVTSPDPSEGGESPPEGGIKEGDHTPHNIKYFNTRNL
ncbi:MAG: hypothetical protein FWF09_01835 [Bacteroidales bacterium]|nr:hypothetical protein [Bacteroidales bacterium]